MATVEVIARVECRSESTGDERPVAVWIGGARLAIDEILDDAVLGSVTAGEPNRRQLTVRLEDGSCLQLRRTLPEGRWRLTSRTEGS